MPNRDEWLQQGFQLTDHPFEPTKLPRRPNLSSPLNVFAETGLAEFFAEVGSFATAKNDVSDFLLGQGFNIDSGTPLVVLIEGPGGTGRKTVANYIAHLMKGHCQTPPAYREIRVNTNHFGRLLYEVKQALQFHFASANPPIPIDSLQSRDTQIQANDPDETLLTGLFSDVAQMRLGPPLLILLIRALEPYDLELKNFEWIAKLHNSLRDLNVALLFLTKDTEVTERFRKALVRNDYPGFIVRLKPLTVDEGQQLLQGRLDIFRVGARGVLTPYETDAIRWIFTAGTQRRAIKPLLNLCRVAMNRKLADLVKSQPAIPPSGNQVTISEPYIREVWDRVLHQMSWGGGE